MGYPAYYRIQIKGNLDTTWSEWLAGMSVTIMGKKNITEITTLEGRVLDQAELTGILNTLYDLQFPLISVEFLDRGVSEDKRET
jgi:hypothetical protein